MNYEIKKQRAEHHALIISLFSAAVLLCSYHYQAQNILHGKWNLNHVIATMNAHLSDSSFLISSLARSNGMSIRTLQRNFQDSFGVKPIEYLQKLRLHRAVALLHNTNQTNKSIASQCGFSDYSHMYRIFKKYLNSSPTDLRHQDLQK